MINILNSKWCKIIQNTSKTKNHLIVLDSLWSKPCQLEELGVNYKTASRIINQLVRNGLVAVSNANRKKHYHLTNTGRVISAFSLGKFADATPAININPVISKEDFVIERQEVVEEILFNVQRKRHVLILGDSGFGKTTLMKLLNKKYLPDAVYVESRPAKYVVETIAESLGVGLKTVRGRRKRTIELLDDIGGYMSRHEEENRIILLDEVEECPKQVSKIIKRLQRSGFVIVGAGTENKRSIDFKKDIKLKPLSNEESVKLVQMILSQELDKTPEDIVNLIKLKSGGIPERIKQHSDDVLISIQKGDVDMSSKNSKHTYTSKLKNYSHKRINLISPRALVSFAFLLLATRYMLYGTRNYQLGYAFAMVAYIIFFLFRWKRK